MPTSTGGEPPATAIDGGRGRTRLAAIWAGIRATIGALMGLTPHVLHHVGFIAGAALLTGVVGNLALFAVGLLLSIPMLRRLGRRFGTWKAPTIGVVVFTALFAVSTFVIGPLLNQPSTGAEPPPQSATSESPSPIASESDEHTGHHE